MIGQVAVDVWLNGIAPIPLLTEESSYLVLTLGDDREPCRLPMESNLPHSAQCT